MKLIFTGVSIAAATLGWWSQDASAALWVVYPIFVAAACIGLGLAYLMEGCY